MDNIHVVHKDLPLPLFLILNFHLTHWTSHCSFLMILDFYMNHVVQEEFLLFSLLILCFYKVHIVHKVLTLVFLHLLANKESYIFYHQILFYQMLFSYHIILRTSHFYNRLSNIRSCIISSSWAIFHIIFYFFLFIYFIFFFSFLGGFWFFI